MAGENITLYWGSGSPPCWRILLVLEEKGLSSYQSKLLSFEKKEHKTEEIIALNPRGQLPTMKVGDLVINESLAACHYLENVYKNQGTTLIPSNSKDMAEVLQRTFEALNLQTKLVTDVLYYIRLSKPEELDKTLLEKKYQSLRDEINLWEGYSKQHKGDHIAGKSFSMADVVFYPFLAFMVRVGLRIDNYPALKEYYNTVSSRPSVKNTWPPHWKETPKGTSLDAI